jgi:hypothetical protein
VCPKGVSVRKNVVRGFLMLDQADLSTNQQSIEVNTLNLDKASIYVDWTGTAPVGTLVVEAKNSESGDWFPLDFGSAIAVSGASGQHTILLNELPFYAIRLAYTTTSGSGAIDALIVAKTVGA